MVLHGLDWPAKAGRVLTMHLSPDQDGDQLERRCAKGISHQTDPVTPFDQGPGFLVCICALYTGSLSPYVASELNTSPVARLLNDMFALRQ
ncbi:hypothetical protein Y1Q_0013762 [Alligator mississippiensis]|uniref:Uncharacterized protein n=1 Tax=Alligator mississippiensis TaxID=8496 RepID=A0A151MM46_ALLMI|nr:hypothetical protein Y1Q_0013762 [Alligator mississippiensis]